MLMYYELRKIFSKRANQIVLLMLVVLTAYTCIITLRQIEWVDGSGEIETGRSAAVKFQEARKEWSGPLDQSLLEKALAELKEIYSSTEVDAHSEESNWLLRSKMQGVQNIADLLGLAYLYEYSSFEELAANLQAEDLCRFYDNRVETRRIMLYEDDNAWGRANYSEKEKAYILSKFQELHTPLEMNYHEGWVQATEKIPTLFRYGMILLSFILAGIFSDEFSMKTDAIYYNTLYGRTKATAAKMGTGFFVMTGIFFLCVGAFTLVVLGGLGAGGGHCGVQSHSGYWNIRENMTFLQKYVLTIGSGYLGFLFMGFLIMWISAKTKSPVLAVLIPSLLILLPEYLRGFNSPSMRRFIGLLPDKLLDIGEAIQYLYLYSIGDQVMTAVPIVLTVYPCMTLLLIFLCYREYRHKQVT